MFLYRVYDASGLVYEAALPAGMIAAPDSVRVEAPKRISRRDPYPDRVINGQRLPSNQVKAFQGKAGELLANDPSNPGRPTGSTRITQDSWPTEYARAKRKLRTEDRTLIANSLDISPRTLDRYKRKWGVPGKRRK
jgi:hypothetical protein